MSQPDHPQLCSTPVQRRVDAGLAEGRNPLVLRLIALARQVMPALYLIVALACFPGPRPAFAQETASGEDHVLVVGTKVAPPFAMKADDGSWSGISIRLWRRIAADLHLNYRFQEVSLDELINGVAARRLDASIGAITVTAARADSVDFTQSYYSTGLGITVRKLPAFNWLRLSESLFSLSILEVLFLLVAAAILVGFMVWLIERRHTEQFRGGVRHGLGRSMLWSAQTLTQAMPQDGPTTLPGRILAIIWLGVAVTAVAVFTAGLTTHFTAQQLEGYVRGATDLHTVRVGAVAATSAIDYLREERIRFHAFPDAAAGLKAVRDGSIDAFVYDKPLMSWLVLNHYADSLQVLDVVFDQQNYAIALPAGSPLRTPIEHAMLRVLETSWWRDMTSRYSGRD